jgi:hypothetical protein
MLQNHRPVRFVAILFTLLVISASVYSQRFGASLDQAQEVPPTGSAGVGYGNVVVSPDGTQITVNMGFTGLGTAASAAHIHTGAVGVNGPVTFGLAGVPAATSGVIPQQTFAITAGQLADLLAGNMYFNVHSAGFPGGEIRGQILPPLCTTAMAVEVHATAGTMGPTGYGNYGNQRGNTSGRHRRRGLRQHYRNGFRFAQFRHNRTGSLYFGQCVSRRRGANSHRKHRRSDYQA